jgi:hypothetical protein
MWQNSCLVSRRSKCTGTARTCPSTGCTEVDLCPGALARASCGFSKKKIFNLKIIKNFLPFDSFKNFSRILLFFTD